MKTFLKIILALRGCRHRWEIYHTIRIIGASHEYTRGYEYHLRCQKCGAIKRRSLA